MFGDGGERHVEGLGEFRDFGFAPGKTGEDGAACRMGKSAEGGVERGRIVNHTV